MNKFDLAPAELAAVVAELRALPGEMAAPDDPLLALFVSGYNTYRQAVTARIAALESLAAGTGEAQ